MDLIMEEESKNSEENADLPATPFLDEITVQNLRLDISDEKRGEDSDDEEVGEKMEGEGEDEDEDEDKPDEPESLSPSTFDMDYEVEEKFQMKYFPMWFIFFFLVFLVLFSYTFGKFRAREEYSLVISDIDNFVDSIFRSVDPHLQKFKKEAFDKAFEPLKRYFETSIDPMFDRLKLKMMEYKNILSSYIPDDKETIKFLEEIRNLNLTAKYPVIIIPGTVTSNLEVWKGKPCMKKFREKIWGGLQMFKTFLSDRDCWLEHMLLDEDTGLDPPGVRVRSRAEAIEYWIPYFWVWARVSEELSRIGYDRNNMKMMEFDWRLAYKDLQKRDYYFSRVKMNVELLYEIMGEKVIIITHSMGGLVANHFLNWVESSKGGKENSKFFGMINSKWCDEHIHSVINIGAPLLGLPKVVSSILSGEFKDTADLYWADNLIEKLLPRELRIRALRSWNSNLEMLPKGPSSLWGKLLRIPSEQKFITMDNLTEFLSNYTDPKLSKKLENHFLGVNTKFSSLDDPRYWSNPFSFQLPYAPNMKIYCMYGTGLETEMGYDIIKTQSSSSSVETVDTNEVVNSPKNPFNISSSSASSKDDKNDDEEEKEEIKEEKEESKKALIDQLLHYEFDFVTGENRLKGPLYRMDQNGDGTCPRISMAYPCAQLWKDKIYNPGGVKTVTREYAHKPIENILSKQFDLRGGGFGASHVDILGHLEIIRDVLYIVSGNGGNLTDLWLLEPFEKLHGED